VPQRVISASLMPIVVEFGRRPNPLPLLCTPRLKARAKARVSGVIGPSNRSLKLTTAEQDQVLALIETWRAAKDLRLAKT
jgi:hypothetical protein